MAVEGSSMVTYTKSGLLKSGSSHYPSQQEASPAQGTLWGVSLTQHEQAHD